VLSRHTSVVRLDRIESIGTGMSPASPVSRTPTVDEARCHAALRWRDSGRRRLLNKLVAAEFDPSRTQAAASDTPGNERRCRPNVTWRHARRRVRRRDNKKEGTDAAAGATMGGLAGGM
jgi:hypothetical protein